MLPIALLSVLTSIQAEPHCASFKSFCSADRECSRYLGQRRSCAIRCRGIVTRFWNRTSRMPSAVIDRFYEPEETDYLYLSRTMQCLSDVRTDNVCEQARKSVLCYDREFGVVDREGLRFVPFTYVQHRRILQECEAILQKNGALDSCLLRCFLIREGLYSDRDGPRVERIAVQWMDVGGDIRLWTSGACVEKLQAERVGECEMAVRIFRECFNVDLTGLVRGLHSQII